MREANLGLADSIFTSLPKLTVNRSAHWRPVAPNACAAAKTKRHKVTSAVDLSPVRPSGDARWLSRKLCFGCCIQMKGWFPGGLADQNWLIDNLSHHNADSISQTRDLHELGHIPLHRPEGDSKPLRDLLVLQPLHQEI